MSNTLAPPIDLKLAAAIVDRTATVEQLRTALTDLGYTMAGNERYEVWSPGVDQWRDGPILVPLDTEHADFAGLISKACAVAARQYGDRHFGELVRWVANIATTPTDPDGA